MSKKIENTKENKKKPVRNKENVIGLSFGNLTIIDELPPQWI